MEPAFINILIWKNKVNMSNGQKWLKGWKVIRSDGRRSCTGTLHKQVIYNKNNIVGRPEGCGPLAVFRTRNSARSFIKENFRHSNIKRDIVECLYIRSKHRTLWIDLMRCGMQYHKTHNFPEGTAFADVIKCLE